MEELLELRDLLLANRVPEALLLDAYESALRQAALEVFEGRYEATELGQLVDQSAVMDQAMAMVLDPPTMTALER